MDKELKNAIAISSLKEEIEKWKNLQGNILKFTTYVIYQHGKTIDQEQMVVRIQLSGFNNGDIEMDEGQKISSNTHHLGFSARLQDYDYDEATRTFTITGNSPKMGSYKVQFTIDGIV